MISYKKDKKGKIINQNYIEKLVKAHKSNWLDRAKKKTDKYRTAGKVTDKNGHIWSEIKEVFMTIQGNKCAFCETELEGQNYGKGVHDVEHFRPKNRITKWKPSKEFNSLGISITSTTNIKGYHLLTYNLLNYSMSCGPCNQTLKSDRFPIKGSYKNHMEDPKAEFNDEEPLLIYPIADIDTDCEELICFEGPVPKAVKTTGLEYERAQTTIDFFRLARADERSKLFKERSEVILLINIFIGSESDTSKYDDLVGTLISDTSKHANCTRSYLELLKNDPVKAKEIFNEARQFIATYIPDSELG
ncbi:HNH endonuclease family protein [Aestuariivivens insulae]|uniref:hypothetical protein n=1 Tax=Aestuariivivens insulae TaxID=1621988 RepID=UPI001F599F2C|nr:hypothetical protein [Aestuariivivens insulae]